MEETHTHTHTDWLCLANFYGSPEMCRDSGVGGGLGIKSAGDAWGLTLAQSPWFSPAAVSVCLSWCFVVPRMGSSLCLLIWVGLSVLTKAESVSDLFWKRQFSQVVKI